ncbi:MULTISPECIES: GNAT family N-acetyltransferase [Paenibacillus]|uniref:N-acetyltransferase domain-containing protein n=1 Tax=Paenibacillus borealis TaxID=160799 RepID=A0ABX3HGM0_PAEBO|nr:GNAT family N-acetyltransferase [Paenibacillus borealis]OMD49090.1 hypothetical protein BSK56_09670 [Paenibacillus borealis]
MDETEFNKILQLISMISSGAEGYVRAAFADGAVSVIYYGESGPNQGVFCLAEGADCVIAYAVFRQCGQPDVLLEGMESKINPYLQANEEREICFNVYGRNTEIVQFVRGLGFSPDIEGYQLRYAGNHPVEAEPAALLQERGFTPEMLESFIALFDGAYEQLNRDNGWDTDQYRREPESFLATLAAYEAESRVRSFWIRDSLVGAYITEGEYIRDIVVAPEYQNRGYGGIILNHCINRMREQGDGNIFLRVAGSNAGAKRLYERNHFVETACFAEHTYRR